MKILELQYRQRHAFRMSSMENKHVKCMDSGKIMAVVR